MSKLKSIKSLDKLSDLNYLNMMMSGKKHLIYEMLELFLKNFPLELQSINHAILKKDYLIIKRSAHTMQSSVAIVGISTLSTILREIEELASIAGIEKIKVLKRELNAICRQALEELENDKYNYA
jgi:HPt (histidine-containing phosphotransfer) domain-containing protein